MQTLMSLRFVFPRNLLLRTVVLGWAMFSWQSSAHAQSYWPSDQKWQQIRANMATDPELKQVLESKRKLADLALRSSPQAIETVSSGGRLQGDAKKLQTEDSMKDMDKIQALAVAYAIYHDPGYVETAGHYLATWADTNHPTGQPIDETAFEPAIFAYRIVRPVLPADERSKIDAWWRAMARAEIASRELGKGTTFNNWHSHRIKTVGLIGFALDDAELKNYALRAYRAQIQDNLRPDGSSIDFAERDALSYHVYDLRPLASLALAFAETGEDLYHWRAPNGASLAQSVEWLIPYVRGERSHAEFVGTKVKFDIARSNNHEAGHEIGTAWNPKDAVPLLDLVAAYDSSYADLARQLSSSVHLRLVISNQLRPATK